MPPVALIQMSTIMELEGGCLVFPPGGSSSGPAQRTTRLLAGRRRGATAISLRLIELAPGLSRSYINSASEEALYVLAGKARIFLDGRAHDVARDTGVFVAPGVSFTAEVPPGDSGLLLASSRCPDPGAGSAVVGPPCTEADPVAPVRDSALQPVVRLDERSAEVTADRWYKVILDRRAGSQQLTQFVGSIPVGKAPAHYHEYEEVLVILRGKGIMWAGDSQAPIGQGSCIFLPRRQVHCVENTGSGELRLLGMFYPAGSPAVRYDTGPGS